MKKQCVDANKKIKELGLVKLTWGNVSLLSECGTLVYIKPSGVAFETMVEDDISVVNLKTGELLEGKKQSVDTNIHLEIYREFDDVKSIIHTHSKYATSHAQAQTPIRCLGTTHADYFDGDIPVTRNLTKNEIAKNYEMNIGKCVVEWFQENKSLPTRKGAVLLPSHGVLTFGKSADQALENAIVLEEVAEMNILSNMLNSSIAIGRHKQQLFKKHYDRKNGVNKYYGQG